MSRPSGMESVGVIVGGFPVVLRKSSFTVSTQTFLSLPKFVDVSENALYWYFVVFTWLPIYAIVYFGPRIA